jgi:hypothetical protein
MEYEIGGNEPVSTAVVNAVSAVDGRHPTSLPPLTHVLDPDALDVLFAPRSNGELRPGGHVSFVYATCRVSVDNGEYVTIDPLESLPRAVRDPASDGQDGR